MAMQKGAARSLVFLAGNPRDVVSAARRGLQVRVRGNDHPSAGSAMKYASETATETFPKIAATVGVPAEVLTARTYITP